MAWARYDDELPMNRKIAALRAKGISGIAALGLHLLANTWSRHNGTCGHIPAYVPEQLIGRDGPKLARLLGDVAMFDADEDGWWIHDFDDFSDPNDDGRSAAERKKEISEKRAAAGRQGGLAKAAKSSSKHDGKTVAELEQTSGPVPVPAGVVTTDIKPSSPVPIRPPVRQAGDFSAKAIAVATLYADEAVKASVGYKGRPKPNYHATAMNTALSDPDLERWVKERPGASISQIVAWLNGDKHSMQYCPIVEEEAS